jgi:hypothetical protein
MHLLPAAASTAVLLSHLLLLLLLQPHFAGDGGSRW